MKITVEVEVPDGEACENCLFLHDPFSCYKEFKRPVDCNLFKNDCGLHTNEQTIKKFPSCLAACQKAEEQQAEIAKTGLTVEQILDDQTELILLKSIVRGIAAERDIAMAELSALKEAVRWIPVSERLPDSWKRKLIKLQNDYIVCASYSGLDWLSDSGQLINLKFVTHWRELEVSESEEK